MNGMAFLFAVDIFYTDLIFYLYMPVLKNITLKTVIAATFSVKEVSIDP